MTRLLIHVEGQTEETFVKAVVAPYLYTNGYTSVGARLVGNARQRNRRGGMRACSAVRRDILNHLREDPACFATTMVDYYGLPVSGDAAWRGRERLRGRLSDVPISSRMPSRKISVVNSAMI